MDQKDIAGYFVWAHVNGRKTYHRYHVWGSDAGVEQKKYYEDRCIGQPIPLTEFEFSHMTLDQLAKAYPCPQS